MPTFMAGGMIILALLLVSIIHNASLLPPVILLNYSMVISVLLIAFRFALNIGGKLLKTSMKVKRQLIIDTKQRQLESRVARGLGELRVYMRGIMYFRKVQFLLYLRVVLMRTINLLLITRGRLEINWSSLPVGSLMIKFVVKEYVQNALEPLNLNFSGLALADVRRMVCCWYRK